MSSIGTGTRTSARATLDAWRERGADRLDPMRFHFIEALDRRAASYSGEARRVLDEKLSALLAAYSVDIERAAASESSNADSAAPERGPLAALLDYMASQAPAKRDGVATYPELEALEYFREISSKVRTERQFRQSLEQVPGNAGPLNSSSLVHRSLSLMRELSPGYLQQFLSYVDALSWMELMNGGNNVASKDAPRAGSNAKSGRGKSR